MKRILRCESPDVCRRDLAGALAVELLLTPSGILI